MASDGLSGKGWRVSDRWQGVEGDWQMARGGG